MTRITVLAVDDTDDNLDLLEEMLEDEVWSFVRARTGEEAIRLATECRPDVVLLDLMMPRMNGLAVARTFRGTEALRPIPIIMQTAHTDREAVLTAKRLGCQHVLAKPVSRERLLAHIRSCVEACPNSPSPSNDPPEPRAKPAPTQATARVLGDALHLVEENCKAQDTPDAAGDVDPSLDTDCLRGLINPDSPVGRKLMKVANSPAFPGRYPARNITEAIVRIGLRETAELIRKAEATQTDRQDSRRTLKALELLENLALLFPDRTATSEGMLALLSDLNGPSAPAAAAVCEETPQKQVP